MLYSDISDEEKKAARAFILQHDFEYLISFWQGLFLLEKEFKRATKGAINIHPSPPEHPGLGMFSHPFVFPEQRQHHGSTLHEIDKVLDHGEIYLAERFPILPRVYMTLAEFFLQCGTLTLKHLRQACEVLSRGGPTTDLKELAHKPEAWASVYFSYRLEEEWLKALPADDPIRDLDSMYGSIMTKTFGATFDSMNT